MRLVRSLAVAVSLLALAAAGGSSGLVLHDGAPRAVSASAVTTAASFVAPVQDTPTPTFG